jgi:hypothetical protein
VTEVRIVRCQSHPWGAPGDLTMPGCAGLTADQSRCYTEFGLLARKTLFFSEASWQPSALPVLT